MHRSRLTLTPDDSLGTPSPQPEFVASDTPLPSLQPEFVASDTPLPSDGDMDTPLPSPQPEFVASDGDVVGAAGYAALVNYLIRMVVFRVRDHHDVRYNSLPPSQPGKLDIIIV